MVDNDRVGVELSRDLSRKVVEHRDEFHDFFIRRYLESLATLYKYNIPSFDSAGCEMALRQGYGVVIGKNKFDQDVILGFIPVQDTFERPYQLFKRRYTGRDITFTVPDAYLLDYAKTADFQQIWDKDNASSGEFIVLNNKQLSITNDYKIIRYYADELAEIVASRYSLIIQSKIMTVIAGDPGDETVNQMISSIYNGNPFVKLAKTFDVEDNIINVENPNLSNNLQTLKAEYQTKLAELNAIFGINMLAVDKKSGVTEAEANGNLSYVTANSNIWLESRQQALDLYNKRFSTNYHVNVDNVAQSLTQVADGKNNENDNESEDSNYDNNDFTS